MHLCMLRYMLFCLYRQGWRAALLCIRARRQPGAVPARCWPRERGRWRRGPVFGARARAPHERREHGGASRRLTLGLCSRAPVQPAATRLQQARRRSPQNYEHGCMLCDAPQATAFCLVALWLPHTTAVCQACNRAAACLRVWPARLSAALERLHGAGAPGPPGAAGGWAAALRVHAYAIAGEAPELGGGLPPQCDLGCASARLPAT